MQFYVSHSNTSYIHHHTPLSPCSIPGCNASCCVPVSSTTDTSRLWKKLVQTFATACHNTSEHMFTLCLQCVYNVFTGCLQGVYCLQYLYIILGRDEKSNDTLSAAAAEWMFMIINSGLFNSEAVGILPAASSNQLEVGQTCELLLTDHAWNEEYSIYGLSYIA